MTILKNILLSLIFCFGFFVPVYRYDVPTDYYYADVETEELGQLHFYIPYNHKFHFGLNGNTFVNEYDKSLLVYAEDSNYQSYYVYFRPFGIEKTYYRTGSENSLSASSDLTITNIIETNLPTLQASNFGAYAVNEPIVYIFMLGVLFICMKLLLK